MTGTDDRSPGSIGQMALSWGMSPEEARRIEAIASALLAEADADDQRSAWADRAVTRLMSKATRPTRRP